MGHKAQSRAAARPEPIVLMGERGRTVAGYMPTPDELAAARSASANGVDRPVAGPHLTALRRCHARNRTGVVGISIGRERRTGRHFLYVNLGSTHRRFCLETVGRTEAWRRALELRREHVRKVAERNTAILHARTSAAA